MSTTTTPTSNAPAELPPLVESDSAEFSESVLKWVWLSWMVFGLSFMLPGMSGIGFGGRMWTVPGWQIALAAHNVVSEMAMGAGIPFRRVRPFTQSQAVMLAVAGTLANWLVIGSGLVALIGSKRESRVLWATWASAMSIVGVAVGLAAGLVVIFLRPATPLVGFYVWALSQLLLTWGLWRVSRYNAGE